MNSKLCCYKQALHILYSTLGQTYLGIFAPSVAITLYINDINILSLSLHSNKNVTYN